MVHTVLKNIKMRKNIKMGLGMALLSVLFFACNQDYPNLLKNVGNDSISVQGNTPKVLYIMLTGARGQAIQEANTPTLTRMAKHAIYTFDGIADYEQAFDSFTVNNAWANMLTGVTQTKTYTDTVWSENKLNDYPSFISRLKKSNPDWKTVALVSSDELKTKFLSDATVAKGFGSDDEATIQAAISQLKSDKDIKVMVTQLSGIENAGEQYGYSNNTAQYIDAIEKADAQIGQLLEALESRENYKLEKWMVVVASGKGGDKAAPTGSQAGSTAYEDMRRNTFVMFYNPQFQTYYVPKPRNTSGAGPFQGKAVKLYGGQGVAGVNAEVEAADQSMFEPGGGAMTVEAKFKFLPEDNSTNALFLSKGQPYGSLPGWGIRSFGDHLIAMVASSDGSNFRVESSVNVKDGKWHTLALVIWKEGNTFNLKFFVDDILAGYNNSNLPAGATVETDDYNLTFGYAYYRWGNPVKMYMADVRMWDVRLSDDVIKEYSCIPGMLPPTHPNIGHLVGFWPCREGSGDVFKNLMDSSGDYDAHINTLDGGIIEWQPFNDVSQNICPAPAPAYYRMVPNSVDIPFEIFQWLGVNVPTEWKLDGKGWVTGYVDVTNPIQ